MIEGDDTSHRFLSRIRQELDKLPLTDAQKDAVIPDLLRQAAFLETSGGQRTSGGLQLDSTVFDFATKLQAVVNHFQNDGLTLREYLNAALRQPQLFYQSPETIEANINGVVARFADDGLTRRDYLQAALRQPPLFYVSPEFVADSITGIVACFADDELTSRDYLQAALRQPSLFCQSPETIEANITGLVARFTDEGLTRRDYLQAALRQPSLFYQSPETIAGHINAVLSFTDNGIFKPSPSRRPRNLRSGPGRNPAHAAAIEFMLNNPQFMTLADDNFGLREVHQRLTNGPTNSRLLNHPRHAVERELMQHLGHDDPQQPVPADGFIAGAAPPTEEQAKRFLLRALIHAGFIRNGDMKR